MSNFKNWLYGKVKPHDRSQLFEDLIQFVPTKVMMEMLQNFLSDKEKAEWIDEFATDLNERGWDWNQENDDSLEWRS